MLVKIIPLLLLTGLTVKGATMGKDQMQYVMNYTKIVATQHEIANLSTVINVELAGTGYLPTVEEWPNVVRSQYNASSRDPIVDLWGYYYDYYPENYSFTITGAGPDNMLGTKDDISSNNTSGESSYADTVPQDAWQ